MGLYRRKDAKSKIYRYSVVRNGVRYQGTTGTSNRKRAELVYGDILRQIEEGGPEAFREPDKPEHREYTFDELMEEYMRKHSIRHHAETTVTRNRSTIKQLNNLFSGVTLESITVDMLEEYVDRREEDDAEPATWAKELELLRAAMNKAKDKWRWIDWSPFMVYRIEKPKNEIVRWLTLNEELLLLAVCTQWLWQIVVLAINTGMRQGELLNLKWPQVDLQRRAVTVLISKNKEPRSIPLTDAAHDLLKDMMAKRENSGYVFQTSNGTRRQRHNVGRAFRKAVADSGIENFRFHDLRHTFASRMVQQGVDLYTVSKLLGHKSLRMTMRYAHLNVDNLRKGVESLAKWREQETAANLLQEGFSQEKKAYEKLVSL